MTAGLVDPVPIGVLGIGGLGGLAIQFAKALGHPVIAFDKRPEGRALAQEVPLRADVVVDPTEPNALDKVRAFAGEEGLAGIIVCTDNLEGTEWSLETLRPHGVAVPLGLPASGVKFNAFTMIFQELVIKGSLVARRSQIEDMMRIVAQHGIKHHITTFGIEDTPQVTDWYMAPDLKGRLVMKISS